MVVFLTIIIKAVTAPRGSWHKCLFRVAFWRGCNNCKGDKKKHVREKGHILNLCKKEIYNICCVLLMTDLLGTDVCPF